MGLDMYLERMPRCGNTTASEVSIIESYFNWKEKKEDPNSSAKKYTLKEWCGVDYKKLPSKQVIDFYKQHYHLGYEYWDDTKEYSGRNRLKEQIGYWRKANHIHNWLVDRVQDGIDDCCYHNEVTKEVLEELLSTCQKVLDNSQLVDGKIQNGKTYQYGQWVPIMEEGQYIEDPSVAMRLLPTTRGCFFGSTEYDQWYYNDIKETIQICKEVLETTDFEKQMVFYISSW